MLTIVVYFQTLNNIWFCIWKAKLLMNIAIWYFIPILYSCPHRLLSDGNEYCWTAGGTPLSVFMSHLCSIKIPLFSSLGNGCCECFCCFFSSSGVSQYTSDSSRTGLLPGTISQKPHAFRILHLEVLVLFSPIQCCQHGWCACEEVTQSLFPKLLSEPWSGKKWACKTREWSSVVLKIKHLQMHHSQTVWMHEDPKAWKSASLHNVAASAYK